MMVDTNIVIDLLTPDLPWFEWAVRTIWGAGGGEASAIVAAELAPKAETVEGVVALLRSVRIGAVDLYREAAFRAGRAQLAYRAAGGKREKMLGDFLIGAHAAARNLPLATRDPKPYRRYFPELTLITPETENG